MGRIIYIDFDGVLVNTTNYINKRIELFGPNINTFKNICWYELLKECSELNNNIKYINKISKNNKIVILTHVYSKNESEEKKKYISKKTKNIEIITVPYFIKKCNAVNAYNNILIDDYELNVSAWNKKGGIGIKINDDISIKELLKKYINV